jgi:hypothetical protein
MFTIGQFDSPGHLRFKAEIGISALVSASMIANMPGAFYLKRNDERLFSGLILTVFPLLT